MDNIINSLNEPWIGILIGILGLCFALYQHFRHKGPRLVYQYFGQRLIEGESAILPKDVDVSYKGVPVPRLALTQIIIWNAGHSSIRGKDIVKDDQPTIKFDDETKVLNAEISKTTRSVNKSRLITNSDDQGTCKYTFDFLDSDDGVLLRILHTGKVTRPKVDGTIIGLTKGIEEWGLLPISTFLKNKSIEMKEKNNESIDFMTDLVGYVMWKSIKPIGIIFSLYGILLILISILSISIPFVLNSTEFTTTERILGIILGLLLTLAGSFFWWVNRKRFPDSLTPDELKQN